MTLNTSKNTDMRYILVLYTVLYSYGPVSFVRFERTYIMCALVIFSDPVGIDP
jgi:hypothetical protein